MPSLNKTRLHDKLYLKSNRYKKPKEAFKLLYKILNPLHTITKSTRESTIQIISHTNN